MWVLSKVKQAAKELSWEWVWFSWVIRGTVVNWVGKFLRLILQKHGEVEGWTPEKEGLEAMGNFTPRFPTRIRTNWFGFIRSCKSFSWTGFLFRCVYVFERETERYIHIKEGKERAKKEIGNRCNCNCKY